MKNLIIYDPTLRSLRGHSFEYVAAVLEQAKKSKVSVDVICDRRFVPPKNFKAFFRPLLNKSVFFDFGITLNGFLSFIPKFNGSSFSNHALHATIDGRVPPFIINIFQQFNAKQNAKIFQRFLEKRRYDRVDVLIQDFRYSDVMWLKALDLRDRSISFHINLRLPPERAFSKKGLDEAKEIFSQLTQSSRCNIRVFCDSVELEENYAAHLATPRARFLDTPIRSQPLEDTSSKQKKATFSVGYLGPSRLEKGFNHLPNIVRQTFQLSNIPSLNFFLQVDDRPTHRSIKRTIKELRKIAQSRDDVMLHYGIFTSDHFRKTLSNLDLIILPYISDRYKMSTSGIFREALHLGIPVVVIKPSWMDNELRRYSKIFGDLGISVDKIVDMPLAIKEANARRTEFNQSFHAFHASKFSSNANVRFCKLFFGCDIN